MNQSRLILGIDPGLRHTGWGVVAQSGNRLSFVGAGRISPSPDLPMAARLLVLAEGIGDVVRLHKPDEAAIEETFVNKNAKSALLLGQARGSAILALAQNGLSVAEYAANRIKQSVTGYGHADKGQIGAMIGMLLPGTGKLAADACDALAVAITHAHHASAPARRVG
ncbi:MAG: crossover junction endodeoxyribonuclease RuvC [Alphaproteobacteria bacterium]|nr:crossover junction endodeoxyribonuclease RuvC [Alphaproteobacteria bacterium]